VKKFQSDNYCEDLSHRLYNFFAKFYVCSLMGDTEHEPRIQIQNS